MNNIFKLNLCEIQPSQLYISQIKLNDVLSAINPDDSKSLEPIPIKELDGEFVSTDGHTRGVAWLLSGITNVDVEWEDEDLDWEAYRICVQWCKDESITSISDLKERIVSHEEYEVLWLRRCRIMQEDLGRKRIVN
jgi:hypothetical protein